jgi:hypothetical protein
VGSLKKHVLRADGLSDCRARRAEGTAFRNAGLGTQLQTGSRTLSPATLGSTVSVPRPSRMHPSLA